MNESENIKSPAREETIKIRITISVMAVLCLWIIVTLVRLQIVQHESFLFQAQSQQFGTIPVIPERGNIYDKDYNLLAYNSSDYTVIFNYRNLSNRVITHCLTKIASVTGRSVEYYRKKMAKGRSDIVIEKKITGDTVLKLKALNISYLNFNYEPSRIYTHGSFASHILGYVDSKTLKGLNGIEYSFEGVLGGVKGMQTVEKNNAGTILEVIKEATVKPVRGKNVVLTIEHGIQTAVEEVMGNEKNSGLKGSVIVMNPQNGEILAFYHSFPYDPNQFTLQENQVRKNGAVTDIYEPGSTFKAFTFASLIEHGAITNLNEVIETENGVYSPVKGVTVRDNHKFAYLSVQDVLAQSSNIGTIKLISRLSNEQFYDDIRKLGFGNKTNIPLPSETSGLLRKPSEWSLISKSSIAYGYEIGVSPIQLIAAYAPLINGGIYYEPKLITAVTDETGKLIQQFEAKRIRHIFSPKTSDIMRKLLVRAVESGTGKKARIEGISIGGKTGTSRKLHNGRYDRENYNASFVGFFPADAPKYLIMVVAEINSETAYTGGEIAAPIFREIAGKIIAKDPRMYDNPEAPEREKTAPVQFVSANENLAAEFIPLKGSSSVKIQKSIMPDLSGLSLRDAVKYCNELGLLFTIHGNGLVKEQSIPAGVKVIPGQICLLTGSLTLNGED